MVMLLWKDSLANHVKLEIKYHKSFTTFYIYTFMKLVLFLHTCTYTCTLVTCIFIYQSKKLINYVYHHLLHHVWLHLVYQRQTLLPGNHILFSLVFLTLSVEINETCTCHVYYACILINIYTLT